MQYVWIVHADKIGNRVSRPMSIYAIKNKELKDLKFSDIMTINKDGYACKSKKDYLGYFIKKGKNLTLEENFVLFDKLYKKIMKDFLNGIDKTFNKKFILK